MSDLLSIAQNLSKQPFLGEVKEIVSLERDVSKRRYHRVSYKSGEVRSALLVQLAGGDGPLGGGARDLSQDDAFVEIQAYFAENNIRVPSIYTDARAEGFLLVEDLGAVALWEAVTKVKEDQQDPLTRREGASPEKELMEKGLALLEQIQGLAEETNGREHPCVIFERSPTFEQLQAGPGEFVEFILSPLSISKAQQHVCDDFIAQLAEEIRDHKKVVSHYDFISHNILVLDTKELALIDFQDACLESPARDLHALLCDRGMDDILGEDLLRTLFSDYFSRQSDSAALREMYCEYAVHWDMRVSGRFTKLAHIDGRSKYEQWISGTTARVLQGLERLQKKFPRAGDVLDISRQKLPEVREKVEGKQDVLTST